MDKKVREEILARFPSHGVRMTRAELLRSARDPYETVVELSRLVADGTLLMEPGPDDGKKPPFSSSDQKDEFRLSPRVTSALDRSSVRMRAQQRAKRREVAQTVWLRFPNGRRTKKWGN